MTSRNEEKIAVLEEKYQACEKFLIVTRTLTKALENDETAAVSDLIRRREDLIEEIDGMDRRITRCAQAGLSGRSVMENISGKIKDKLGQIMSANQACEAVASARREGLRNEMRIINRKGEGFQRYTCTVPRIPKFLNIQT